MESFGDRKLGCKCVSSSRRDLEQGGLNLIFLARTLSAALLRWRCGSLGMSSWVLEEQKLDPASHYATERAKQLWVPSASSPEGCCDLNAHIHRQTSPLTAPEVTVTHRLCSEGQAALGV